MTFYLRLEAVNLANFISDTEDLSTVRGASLVLLDMVAKLTTKPEYHGKLTKISSGASTGLFSFDADSDKAAEDLRDLVECDLNRDYCIKHATFVVDVRAATSDFQADRERLIALNRWRQMRQPSVAVPSQNIKHRLSVGQRQLYSACEIDRVRTGTVEMEGPQGETECVSESVESRRSFGRIEKKGSFYKDRTGIEGKFTRNLEQLTSEDSSSGKLGNLDGKMAVIYLDGNGFGGRQARCDKSVGLSEWDRAIQQKRNAVLRGLIERMLDEQEGKGWRRTDGTLRIETLLWGGDDLLWVVPAWKGIETLIHFFSFRERDEQPFWEFQGQPLTHAAGVVFCHRNAPIYRIRRLAEQLAGLAKEHGRDRNLVAYEVLESFDHTGTDLKSHRHRWFRNDGDPETRARELILEGDQIKAMGKPMHELKKEFPRRQLHRIVQAALTSEKDGRKAADDVVATLDEKGRNELALLASCLGSNPSLWIHLAELWDYFV